MLSLSSLTLLIVESKKLNQTIALKHNPSHGRFGALHVPDIYVGTYKQNPLYGRFNAHFFFESSGERIPQVGCSFCSTH